jgi:hypothetical protein
MEAVLPVGLSSTNLRQRVRILARQLEVRMLVIDEIHAMLSGTFREQRIFLNCLRFLANDLHLPLVCVGTNEAKQALMTDQQLADRSLDELLEALLERYPGLRSSREVCLDHGLPPAWCQALAKWSRLDEAQIHALDLGRWFPGRDLSWFSRRWDLSGKPDSAEGSPWWTAAKFCLRCVRQQVRARFPLHRLPEWAPAFVTHCPEHFGEPLRQHCLCCHRQEPGWMIVARETPRSRSSL